MAAVFRGQAAGNDHRTGRDAAVVDFAGFAVVDFGGLPDVHAHGNHAAFFDNHAFDDFGTRADEAVVFDDGRAGLQGFEYAADADAAAQVDVFTDLGARADGRPSIDHRAFVHIRADIDVRRHQNGVFADEAAAARHGTGYGAEACGAEFFFAPIGKFSRHFVEVFVYAVVLHFVVLNAEGKQYGFFRPFVDFPLPHAQAFGHAQAAGIELAQGFQHGFFDFEGNGGRRDVGAVFKGGFDDVLQ